MKRWVTIALTLCLLIGVSGFAGAHSDLFGLGPGDRGSLWRPPDTVSCDGAPATAGGGIDVAVHRPHADPCPELVPDGVYAYTGGLSVVDFVRANTVPEDKVTILDRGGARFILAYVQIAGQRAGETAEEYDMTYGELLHWAIQTWWSGEFDGRPVFTLLVNTAWDVDIAPGQSCITVDIQEEDAASGAVGWYGYDLGHINMRGASAGDQYFCYAAAHEFGHILGLDDAYKGNLTRFDSGDGPVYACFYSIMQEEIDHAQYVDYYCVFHLHDEYQAHLRGEREDKPAGIAFCSDEAVNGLLEQLYHGGELVLIDSTVTDSERDYAARLEAEMGRGGC